MSVSGISKSMIDPRKFVFTSLLSVALSIGASVASAAPSAQLTASRTTGTAPLAVYFDATRTTDSNARVEPFRQLGYRFDFDDSGSGTWAHSGKSRNVQVGGPSAAHVFEQPGTYSVQLTVQDPSGATSTASVDIVVASADATFAGTDTMCLSLTTDFSGCPANAERRSSVSAWPTFASGKRYLLRAGQDFSALGTLRIPRVTGTQVGSFGAGAKPVVSDTQIQAIGTSPTSLDWIRDFTLMGIDSRTIHHDGGGQDILLLRNSITRGGGIKIANAFHYWLERSTLPGWKYAENIFLVENFIDANNSPDYGQYGIYAGGAKVAIMGNEINRIYMHNIRMWMLNDGFIAHNRLHGRSNDGIRHAIKLHSYGLLPYEGTVTGEIYSSRRIVIADNLVGDPLDNDQWLFAIEPLTTSVTNGLENVIVENNRFITTSRTVADVHMAGKNLIMRGNARESGGEARLVGVTGGYNIPAEWYGPYYLSDAAVSIEGPATASSPPEPPSLNVQ